MKLIPSILAILTTLILMSCTAKTAESAESVTWRNGAGFEVGTTTNPVIAIAVP